MCSLKKTKTKSQIFGRLKLEGGKTPESRIFKPYDRIIKNLMQIWQLFIVLRQPFNVSITVFSIPTKLTKVYRVYFTGKALTVKPLKKGRGGGQ